MKIRNVVGLIALAMVVLTSVSVYAAGTVVTCPTCKDDSGVRHVNLPTGAQCATGAFDFDNTPGAINFGTHVGYCNNIATGGVDDNVANYRAVMAVCDCITANPSLSSRFDAGDSVGIRMTIMVDGVAADRGVYWANSGITGVDINGSAIPNTTTVAMDTHTSKANVCADPSYDKSFGIARYYLDAAATKVATITTPKCSPAASERAISLQTYPLTDTEAPTVAGAQGYTIDIGDENLDRSYWGIDIPPMYVSSNAAAYEGKKIQVKIEILDAAGNTICASCTPICECTIDIAIIGCSSGTFCMTFPYVVTQIGDSTGWSTGIAVANMQKDVTSPVVTFTITDSEGKAFTASQSMTKTVNAWMLDDILDSWTWTPAGLPAPGPAFLKVSGNFWMDGYQFMTDGNFGAGTQPRQNCVIQD